VISTQDVRLSDGRIARVHDTGPRDEPDALALLWNHGTPQTGALLEPLVSASEARGIRLLSYGRPSYGGSSPHPGRNVASAAADVAQILDALGIARIAVMGASGGGTHALACAALLTDRVTAVVSLASLAPFSESFDWYAGMFSDAALRAAAEGRDARERYAATEVFDENIFIPADWTALEGVWAPLGTDSVQAGADGPDGAIDDDVAYVMPWGFDLAEIEVPALIVHGGLDRVVPPSHGDWLMRHCETSEFWFRPRDGHISVLGAIPVAMDWLNALT
jgi:pimeloyl-ACP methyl ester carboxylesterase